MDVIKTERLILRHQSIEDAPFVFKLMNDPAWLRYIGDRGVDSVEDAQQYILNGAVAMYANPGFGLYLVETKEEQLPIGLCGLIRRDFLAEVDLGFALAADYRGKGYAQEAAAATLAHAREMGLARVAAIVSPDNVASIRLLEKLGFVFDRPYDYPNGDLVHLYTLPLL